VRHSNWWTRLPVQEKEARLSETNPAVWKRNPKEHIEFVIHPFRKLVVFQVPNEEPTETSSLHRHSGRSVPCPQRPMSNDTVFENDRVGRAGKQRCNNADKEISSIARGKIKTND